MWVKANGEDPLQKVGDYDLSNKVSTLKWAMIKNSIYFNLSDYVSLLNA